MRNRVLTICLITALTVSMLAGCGGSGSENEKATESGGSAENAATGEAAGDLAADLDGMKNMELNWAISLGSSHRANEIFQYFADEVSERTNGKVKITLYPGDTLVTSASIYDSLVQGIVDMGEADPSYSVAAFPMSSALFLPGMQYANSEVATYVADDFFTQTDEAEFQEAHFLFAFGMSPSIIFGNKKVESLEDFSGVQIRGTGFAVDVIETLGASAVGITPSETYEALLKGTADAALMPAEALVNWSFAEVSKYACQVTGFSTSFHYVAINNEVWDSMPASVQQVIEEVADECVTKLAPLWDEMSDEGYAFAEEKGTEIYEMSEANLQECMNALETVQKDWVDEKTAEGYDAQAVIDYLDASIEKYNDQYGE